MSIPLYFPDAILKSFAFSLLSVNLDNKVLLRGPWGPLWGGGPLRGAPMRPLPGHHGRPAPESPQASTPMRQSERTEEGKRKLVPLSL